VVLTALAPAYAQQGGVAGTALAAAAEVQPPPLAQFPAEPMPPLAATAPVVPTLAPQPAVAAKRPEAAKKLDAKYDVSKIGDRGVGRGLDFYSLERERAMGRELAQQVESESHMIKDPVITEYINRVGQRIVRNSDARVPFTIKVIDDDEINAFALPGGYFYVNTGLIMAADNEAELAGVMAHEIAHVAARHATKNATKMQILNLVSIPMIFIGGPVGYAVRQVAGLAVPMSFLKFSRDAEREADLLGLEYEYACGYDPEEFVKFFEKLKLQQKQKHSFLAKAFNTHPMTSDRIRRAQEEIADYLPAKNEYVVDTSEFEQVKARLANLMNEQKIGSGTGYPAPPTLRKRPHDTVSTGEKPGGDSSRSGKPPTLRHP
jgi:predicted Zn-dependent protease